MFEIIVNRLTLYFYFASPCMTKCRKMLMVTVMAAGGTHASFASGDELVTFGTVVAGVLETVMRNKWNPS